ncbi:caspase family protein [Vibrio coralliirubri]|uniref:caspase family protein n=1 Tax=Vibrio coralliirubri TaxID=1516159 RepID=UPI00073F940D|nr:caspase family protein [Vibrio coralliirubri]
MTALVVGNNDYARDDAKLINAVNDANDISATLDSLGFSVIKLTDCKNEDLDRAMSSFEDGLNSNDVGLFYFAGHGLQIDGQNYITCIDSQLTDESAAKWTSHPINRLIEMMDRCSNKTNIIILDACRDNPYERGATRSLASTELAPMFAPKGTLIAFSTSPGEKALDGSGSNGAYTEALLKHIKKPDVTIEDIFKKVRNSLSVISNGKQTSWEHTSLTGDFYFNLSLGSSINKYSNLAIADELFSLDLNDECHKVINSLKTYNWYKQNPAVESINNNMIIGADNDSLFILGRNIYQAACGSSDSAISLITGFRSKLAGISLDKQLSILEGMLFEVFFNSKGEFRKNFKVTMFNEVFSLSVYPDLKPAFEFISEVLLQFNNHFYIIPGKQIDDATIEIVAEEGVMESIVIKEIYYCGDNILQGEDGWEQFMLSGTLHYDSMRYQSFLDKISKDMMIPESCLSIQSNIPINEDTHIKFPYKHTLKRS